MATFEQIFAALNESGTRYVAVGGIAVILHGYLRLTNDADLVIDLRTENASAAMKALTNIGLRPLAPVDPLGFADPDLRRVWIEQKNMQVFSLLDPEDVFHNVDLFVDYPIPFEDLWSDSIELQWNGVPVRIASLEHVLTMKRMAGRAKDLADIEALQDLSEEDRD
ncbi:MAG: nucleotidyl transferase AbiEii/AbiGii toxin family protein [Actinomycetota bacterium]